MKKDNTDYLYVIQIKFSSKFCYCRIGTSKDPAELRDVMERNLPVIPELILTSRSNVTFEKLRLIWDYLKAYRGNKNFFLTDEETVKIAANKFGIELKSVN